MFLTFSVLVANPKKLLLYTVPNPVRGLLNGEKKKKNKRVKSLAAQIFVGVEGAGHQ